MTEQQWLLCNDARQMLTKVIRNGLSRRRTEPGGNKDWASNRKLRLFACACCRQVWHLLTEEQCQRAVWTAERLADGMVTEGEVTLAQNAIDEVYIWIGLPNTTWSVERKAWWASRACLMDFSLAAQEACNIDGIKQSDILRDIVGNPYRPVVFKAEWRTPVVLRFASSMYDSRDFSAMPIMADALEDAGCTDESILEHCRSECEQGMGLCDYHSHVRGCWVVDKILDKE